MTSSKGSEHQPTIVYTETNEQKRLNDRLEICGMPLDSAIIAVLRYAKNTSV